MTRSRPLQISALALLIGFFAPVWAKTAPPAKSAFRFGQWTLVVSGLHALTEAEPLVLNYSVHEAAELRLYWQAGGERSLALRFNDRGAGKDRAVLRSGSEVQAVDGCEHGVASSLPFDRSDRPLPLEMPELPDDSLIRFGDSERGLRRVGDELIIDLTHFRVKLEPELLNVRIGNATTGDYCRWELSDLEEE